MTPGGAATRGAESRPAGKPPRMSYDRQWRLLIGALLVLDAVVVWSSLTLAYEVRILSGWIEYEASYSPAIYTQFALIGVPIWLILCTISGLYRREVLLGGVGEYARVVRASTMGILVLITISFFWLRILPLSRGWLVLGWLLVCVFLCLERFLVRRAAYALRRRGWLMTRVLIVGANDQGGAIAEQWIHSPTSGMAVVGFADDFMPVGSSVVNGLRVLGRPSDLEALVRQTGSREVVVVVSAVAWESFEEIILRANQRNGFTVRVSPGFYELLASGVVVSNQTFVPLLTVNESRLVGIDAILKRALDYSAGLALCLITSPIMAAIAIGLKLGNPQGPVLDRHRMVGLSGVPFTMVKFHARSRPAPAEDENPPAPGVEPSTRLETLLLRRGLDKLPQIFNVLGGQMGLVGPRPRKATGEACGECVSRNLQTVKPGMIGPWTAGDGRAPRDEAREELDYVRNWTIWLDLQILFQTVRSWWRAGRGALKPAPSSPAQEPATGRREVQTRPPESR